VWSKPKLARLLSIQESCWDIGSGVISGQESSDNEVCLWIDGALASSFKGAFAPEP